jgi:eukaryotic-like serine/threonine-protein kinase
VQHSGKNWEEFYEALFGFEAKLAARGYLTEEDAAGRARFGSWREPVLTWIDRVRTARKEARERRHLQALEAKKLQAEGMDRKEAEDQAEAAAAQLVEQAAEIKAAEKVRSRTRTSADDGDDTVANKRVNIKKMLEAAEKPPKKLPKQPARPLKHILKIILGWKMRFVLGSLLIVGAVLWVKQNLQREQDLNQVVLQELTTAGDVRNVEGAKQEAEKFFNIVKSMVNSETAWEPLEVKVLPGGITGLFDHINPLVAGLILIVSVFFGGIWRAALFILAAGIALLAHRFDVIPTVGPLEPHHLSMIGGTIIAVLTMFLGPRSDD